MKMPSRGMTFLADLGDPPDYGSTQPQPGTHRQFDQIDGQNCQFYWLHVPRIYRNSAHPRNFFSHYS